MVSNDKGIDSALRLKVFILLNIMLLFTAPVLLAGQCIDFYDKNIVSLPVDPIFGITKNAAALVGKNVQIKYTNGDIVAGTVLDIPNKEHRHDAYVLITSKGDKVSAPFTGISDFTVYLNGYFLPLSEFQNKFQKFVKILFEAPYGQKPSSVSALGKTVALYIKDPKNYDRGELVTGKLIDGYPNSPRYDVEIPDGTVREIFFPFILELRILGE